MKAARMALGCGLILLCHSLVPGTFAGTCLDADLVVRNATIVTMDDHNDIADALAVRDRKILAVGTDRKLQSCIGPRTKVMDLGGNTILPGLIDVHTHSMDWAESILRGELQLYYPEVKSVADVQRVLAERVAHTPPGKWILGLGWDDAEFKEHRYLNRHDLDTVASNNPVYFVHISGHLSIANSAARFLRHPALPPLAPPSFSCRLRTLAHGQRRRLDPLDHGCEQSLRQMTSGQRQPVVARPFEFQDV